jgi:hypothetical protein
MSDDGHTIWPTSSLAESETLPEVNADQLALDDIPDYPAPLKPIAFQGPLGAHVLLVKPHTEADPAAVLLQDLVFFGNVINSSSFLGLGRIKATPNINLAIVGPTSTGRKGTSGAEARRLFANVDADWEKRHC